MSRASGGAIGSNGEAEDDAIGGGGVGLVAQSSVLQQQLALLEQDATTWRSKRRKVRVVHVM